jgi:hypothetical protein
MERVKVAAQAVMEMLDHEWEAFEGWPIAYRERAQDQIERTLEEQFPELARWLA